MHNKKSFSITKKKIAAGDGIAIVLTILFHYATWPVVSQVFPMLLPERFYFPTQFVGYFIYFLFLIYPAAYLGLALNVLIIVVTRFRLF